MWSRSLQCVWRFPSVYVLRWPNNAGNGVWHPPTFSQGIYTSIRNEYSSYTVANMSYATRPTSGFIRPSSGLGALQNTGANSHSSQLQSRIQEKRLELESLRQLRDLSAGLAGQMQQLNEKLSTLSTGTEAVAAVMANWNTVLRAVYMASGKNCQGRHEPSAHCSHSYDRPAKG